MAEWTNDCLKTINGKHFSKETSVYFCNIISVHASTYLRGEVSPFCDSLVMHSDTPHSCKDYVLGNLYSKTSHTRDKDIGVLHALHRSMAQHVTTEGDKAPLEQPFSLTTIPVCQFQFAVDLQLSGVQAFIDLSIIAILSHALKKHRWIAICLCNKFYQQYNSVCVCTHVGRCMGQISSDRVGWGAMGSRLRLCSWQATLLGQRRAGHLCIKTNTNR